MKLTFAKQQFLCIGVYVLCFVLSWLLNISFIHNIGWIFYGAMLFMNPVFPESVAPEKLHYYMMQAVGAAMMVIGFTGQL